MLYKECYRVATFLPFEFLDNFLAALSEADVLRYGKYKDVIWYSSPGTEQFQPLEGANPTRGCAGALEKVDSIKIEFSIPRDKSKLDFLIEKVIVPNHPWEEPVISVFETMETQTQNDKN